MMIVNTWMLRQKQTYQRVKEWCSKAPEIMIVKATGKTQLDLYET